MTAATTADHRDVGRELARIRTEAGATQRAVAVVIGVETRTVCRWERGKWRPRPEAVQRWPEVCAAAARQEREAPRRNGPARRPITVDPAWLLRTREEAGATRAWLASVLEVASRTIQAWETGQFAAPADMAGRWPQACAEAARLAARYAAERKAARA